MGLISWFFYISKFNKKKISYSRKTCLIKKGNQHTAKGIESTMIQGQSTSELMKAEGYFKPKVKNIIKPIIPNGNERYQIEMKKINKQCL